MTLKETIWKSKVYSAASQYLNLCRASLRNTPLCPLSRGETAPLTPFITNKKSAFQNSPLERGRGCVTPKHSFLKTKTVTEADRYRLSKQQQNHFNPSRALLHNTPLCPLSRGEIPHSQTAHYQQENSISTRLYPERKKLEPPTYLSEKRNKGILLKTGKMRKISNPFP